MNYTKEMEQILEKEYTSKNVNNQQFINNMLQQEPFKNLTVKSIRSKLVTMKIYKPEDKSTTKTDVDKKTLIAQLTKYSKQNPDVMDGLKNASKPALKGLLEAFQRYEKNET